MSKVFLYGFLIPIILGNTYSETVTDNTQTAPMIVNNIQSDNTNENANFQPKITSNTNVDPKSESGQNANISSNILIPQSNNTTLNPQSEMAQNTSVPVIPCNQQNNDIKETNNNVSHQEIVQNANVSNINNNIQNAELTNNNIELDIQNNKQNSDIKENNTVLKTFKKSKTLNLPGEKDKNNNNTLKKKNSVNLQKSNSDEILNSLAMRINNISENISVFQQQQEVLQRQRQEESEKINKLFNDIYNAGLIVVKHNDNTSTVTTRSQIASSNLPRAELPYDPTMVPTNIIKP